MNIDPAATVLLDEFAQHIGLGNLAFDEKGFCAMRFDGKHVINVQYLEEDGRFLLFADLGPPAGGEKMYATMLQANLFWRATIGATFSLTRDDSPHAVLALTVDWKVLNGAQLAETVERFLDTIEDWSERLASDAESEDADVEEASDLSPTAWMRA